MYNCTEVLSELSDCWRCLISKDSLISSYRWDFADEIMLKS
jgi:hypothetical protein